MTAHPDDALTRYGHTRQMLAGIDSQIQSFQVQAHVHGARLPDDDVATLCDLPQSQHAASQEFAEAARELAGALSEQG